MEYTWLFLITLSLGIGLGFASAQRRIKERVMENFLEFGGERRALITNSEGRSVSCEEMVHTLLMSRTKKSGTKILVLYSVGFGVAVLATVAVLVLLNS